MQNPTKGCLVGQGPTSPARLSQRGQSGVSTPALPPSLCDTLQTPWERLLGRCTYHAIVLIPGRVGEGAGR